MLRKFRAAEWLTLAGTVILGYGALGLVWFDRPAAGIHDAAGMSPLDLPTEYGLFDFTFAPWIVIATLTFAAAMLSSALLRATPGWSVILATPVTLWGFASSIYLTIELLDPIHGYSTASGLYFSVLGAYAIFAGGSWALRDTSASSAFRGSPEPERLTIGGSAGGSGG